jgi:adenylate cyclase
VFCFCSPGIKRSAALSAAAGSPSKGTSTKEWAARASAIDPDDVLAQYNVACFCSLVGEHERAIDLLLALLPRAGRQTKEWVKHDSDLDPIRSHSRFAKMLELLE